MSAPELCGLLLEAAQRDLRLIESNLRNPGCSDEVFGFHAQQAAEKSLKAWLRYRNVEYPHTHDVYTLMTLLSHHGEDVGHYHALESLTPFAVQFRYEGLDLSEERLDRKAVLKVVRDLVANVRGWVEGAGPSLREQHAVYKVKRASPRRVKKTLKKKR
jgi:HEPN domain-containing protein